LTGVKIAGEGRVVKHEPGAPALLSRSRTSGVDRAHVLGTWNRDERAGPRGLDCSHDLRKHTPYKLPPILAECNDCQRAVLEVLLKRNTCVGRQEYFESRLRSTMADWHAACRRKRLVRASTAPMSSPIPIAISRSRTKSATRGAAVPRNPWFNRFSPGRPAAPRRLASLLVAASIQTRTRVYLFPHSSSSLLPK
jgi:hypothetical protein